MLISFCAEINLSNSTGEIHSLDEGQCPTVIIRCCRLRQTQGFYLQSEQNGIAIESLYNIKHVVVQPGNNCILLLFEYHDKENDGILFICSLGTSSQINNTLEYRVNSDNTLQTTMSTGMVIIPSLIIIIITSCGLCLYS